MHSNLYMLFMFNPLHGWLYKAWITFNNFFLRIVSHTTCRSLRLFMQTLWFLKHTVVTIIKDSAQLFNLYPNLSSMCSYRSYNLDHYDHVRFRREKEEVLIEHQESCMFSLWYHYRILARSVKWWREVNVINKLV